ncbi:hypothetical protein SAMN04487926_14250 [Paraburkholderia steynii]|uniref:Uncharacterized protein n=1 Tax=Paraburkholderia steynii TaxID=1245441 RepID=A0A7Z7BIE9_9BURK|nr:hypothetical protein SAMN04487926_14250 [Paraburkholderia steynii]
MLMNWKPQERSRFFHEHNVGNGTTAGTGCKDIPTLPKYGRALHDHSRPVQEQRI